LIAERFGIDLTDAHDAGADVAATLDIVRVCSARLRNNEDGTAPTARQPKTRDHFKI